MLVGHIGRVLSSYRTFPTGVTNVTACAKLPPTNQTLSSPTGFRQLALDRRLLPTSDVEDVAALAFLLIATNEERMDRFLFAYRVSCGDHLRHPLAPPTCRG